MPPVPKPASCAGCPFYPRSRFYVPDERIEGAAVMIVGQNPGETEEREGRPFVGKTGEMQERTFFPLAGLQRGQVSIGNAIRCRLDGSNELPELKDPRLRAAVAHCTREHFRVPRGTRLIVAQGAHALYALTGEGKGADDAGDDEKGNAARTITGWRGYVLPLNPLGAEPMPNYVWTPTRANGDLPVLATLHLASLFRNPKAQVAMMRDWAKVPLILRGAWPEPMPEIRVWPPQEISGRWAFDTEFVEETRQLIRYSLARRTRTGAEVYVVEGREPLPVGGATSVVMHNAEADLQSWEELTGLRWGEYALDDTMHLDAVLWGGMPHNLNYLGSLYARTNRWKHLQHVNPVVYAGGDALGTWDVYEELARQVARDAGSQATYGRQMALVPIIRRARQHGLLIDQQHVERTLEALEAKKREATLRAQAAVGWPINLGSSQQVAFQLYDREKLKRPRRRAT